MADNSENSRVAIGGDLTESQINEVYSSFGIDRGDVIELVVTNSDERHYLEGVVDDSVIGTKSISCVYIEATDSGNGLNISTNNVNWCTPATYANALATAGITDANVQISSPVEVSGTAALTGIYMAYESITGTTLDENAKQAGTEELAVTSELASEIGDTDSTSIVNDIKAILDETKNMSDEELRQAIIDIAADYGRTLSDEEIDQLISLTRSLEKLDTNQLLERVNEVKDTIAKMAQAKETVSSFTEKIKAIIDSISSFFSNLISSN